MLFFLASEFSCKVGDTEKPVLRGLLWDKENVVFEEGWPLKRGSIHMNVSMTGKEKGNILIQVTA